MTKRIAISQSNYLPWKGYFDMIRSVDQFVLYDEVQYTRRDWRNRNVIRTQQGLAWLTVPVVVKGKYDQSIESTLVTDQTWAAKHWSTIRHAYSRAPHFDQYSKPFQVYFESAPPANLSEINRDLLEIVMASLEIKTPLSWSRELTGDQQGRTGRLISICLAAGATTYVSGPAAKAYLDVELFAAHGISVEWFNYDGYPEYRQLHTPFIHEVSIIDLLLITGPLAPRYVERQAS